MGRSEVISCGGYGCVWRSRSSGEGASGCFLGLWEGLDSCLFLIASTNLLYYSLLSIV